GGDVGVVGNGDQADRQVGGYLGLDGGGHRSRDVVEHEVVVADLVVRELRDAELHGAGLPADDRIAVVAGAAGVAEGGGGHAVIGQVPDGERAGRSAVAARRGGVVDAQLDAVDVADGVAGRIGRRGRPELPFGEGRVAPRAVRGGHEVGVTVGVVGAAGLDAAGPGLGGGSEGAVGGDAKRRRDAAGSGDGVVSDGFRGLGD